MLWIRLTVLTLVTACAASPDHSFPVIEMCPGSRLDCSSSIGEDWRRLDSSPFDQIMAIKGAKALAQERTKNGGVSGLVPTNADFELLRKSSNVEWFKRPDSSFLACLPSDSKSEDPVSKLTIYQFDKSGDIWTMASGFSIVSIIPCD